MRPLATTAVALALAAALAAPASALGGGGKPNEYVPGTLDTPEQRAAAARKYWKGSGLKKIRAAGYTKTAIVEFSVEYVTLTKSDWSGSGFGLLDVAQAASGAGKKTVELDEELKQQLPAELYAKLAEAFTTAGYEVRTLEEVSTAPAYAELRGSSDPGKNKTRSGGQYGQPSKMAKAEVYPVEGLINVKMGAFAVMSNVETLAQLANDLGVDMVARAHFRVGVIKGGRPTLEAGSWIWVGAGAKDSGNGKYYFSQYGQLDAKDGFVYSEAVTDSIERKGAKKGKVMDVNSEEFRAALLEMFPAYAGMAVSLLDAD